MASTIPLAAAALVTQVVLLAIVFAATLSTAEEAWYFRRPRNRPWRAVGVYALLSLVPLLVSSDIGDASRILGAVGLSGLALSTSTTVMFVSNIGFVGYLVHLTGGTRYSPFTPVLLTLLALSVFLGQSLQLIALYVVLISVALAVGYTSETREGERSASSTTRWTVAVACLVLTAVVGYMTNPAAR